MYLQYISNRKQKGMTLIESLVAAVILFMVIGLAATVFQHSALLQTRVLKQIEKQEIVDFTMRNVRFALEQGQVQGQFQFYGAVVQWSAKAVEELPYITHFDSDEGVNKKGAGKVVQYQVLASVDSIKNWELSYEEVVWLK
ncbi:PilW family protein [Vibrio parahaemolyticus]|uniref:PilW family protein n=1 Tax=Vibrio parahaemolyticus TaxID=670 RepID=UPI00235E3935|nr:type II secretion system protein [Vibrio parahaemolyticus]